MVIFRRRIVNAPRRGTNFSQIEESEKTGAIAVPYGIPKFNSSGLIVSGTVEPSPEWYQSLQQTVEYIVDQRIQQTLPALQQMVNSMIEAKTMEQKLSEMKIVEIAHQDLTKEQIKNLILQQIQIGQIFYPSDIADKFGLDLIVVMDAINELQKEGKLKNAGNVNVGLP